MIANPEKLFDVWRNHDGQLTARSAIQRFVSDADAPYGFHTHEIRVLAANGRLALTEYHRASR